MTTLGLCRCALPIGVVSALLAGCGGSQAPIGASSAMPQSRPIAGHADRGGSWMRPGASTGELIYATGGCGGTCVISYTDGSLVGSINAPGELNCSDSNGNVFITYGSTVTEYAHGGTTPINILNLPGDLAAGCSVDLTTNNLAVVFRGTGKDVAIFGNEQGTPSLYVSSLDALYCGYDASGSLFVDGYNSDQSVGLSEMREGSSTFTKLTVQGGLNGPPAQVQWDGHYITYQSVGHPTVKRLSVSGSTATVVHTTHLKRITRHSFLAWIYKGSIVVPYDTAGTRRANKIGIWKYPTGGKPQLKYTGYPGNPSFQAVTVSASL